MADLQDDLRLAYLFISHDLGVVRHIAHDVLVMYLGHAVEQGPKGRIFALMGYDLVEGQLGQQQGRNAIINERMRISFAPRGGPPAEDNGMD